MSFIDPINVTLGVGGQVVSRVGFGNPLIVGFTGSRSILISGSGQGQIVYKSVVRKAAVTVQVTVDTGFTYNESGNDITITIPSATTTVRELVADFDANASGAVKAVINLQIGVDGLGLGAVTAIASPTALVSFEYGNILALSQLQYYYDTSDAEYKIFTNLFNSAPSPRNKYLLDVFGDSDPSATVQAVDDGSWYCLLTTSVTQSEQQELAEYIVTQKRIAIFVSATTADAEVFPAQRVAYVIHDAPNDHPEVSWAALALPNLPGSITWAYLGPLTGQTPNATASLTALLAVRAANAQSYVEGNNLKYMDEGLTTDPNAATYIDQVRSRDWIELNLEADLQSLLVNSGGKIPYTNQGIQRVVDVIVKRLEQAGDNGIIRPIENETEAQNSSSNNYVFRVTAPTRQEVAEDNPGDITARQLNGITFSFEESGAIHGISATGSVVIPT